jgi:hypothetical protein
VHSPEWAGAIVKGRIKGPDKNGFLLETSDGPKGFYPAKIGADGGVEFDPTVEDLVTP